MKISTFVQAVAWIISVAPFVYVGFESKDCHFIAFLFGGGGLVAGTLFGRWTVGFEKKIDELDQRWQARKV